LRNRNFFLNLFFFLVLGNLPLSGKSRFAHLLGRLITSLISFFYFSFFLSS
jgi:hypothetical protein